MIDRRTFIAHLVNSATAATCVSGTGFLLAGEGPTERGGKTAGDDKLLGFEQHTRIMETALSNLPTLEGLVGRKRSLRQRATASEALQSLLETRRLDRATGSAISQVIRVLPSIENSKARMPAANRNLLSEISREIDAAKDSQSVIRVLVAHRDKIRDRGVADGIGTVVKMIQHGEQQGIYSERLYAAYVKRGKNAFQTVLDVLKEDGKGGLVGALIPPPGQNIVPGAAGASILELVNIITDKKK